MGVRAALNNLLSHISPFRSQLNRHDDRDPFFHRGSGERNVVASSIPRIRPRGSNLPTPSKFAFDPSSASSKFPTAPLATPTTATSVLDAVAERLDSQYDINHIYHYLSFVESDLLQQTRLTADQSIEGWLSHAGSYLPELIRLEGRGDFVSDVCCGCRDALHEGYGLRCDDCQDRALYCTVCSMGNHERHPLHRIRRWTGRQFEPVDLSLVGLRFQLGHPIGEKCPNPDVVLSGSIIVLDLTGFHQVAITFCSCKDAVPPYVQLLRQRWFPAACQGPRSAATFRLLEHFHTLSSHSNVSALSYYRSLLRATNNTGVNPPSNQLPAFLVMIREWQLLKTLKRAGVGSKARGNVALPPDLRVTSWVRRLPRIARLKKGLPKSGVSCDGPAETTSQGSTSITCHPGVVLASPVVGEVREHRDAADASRESPCASSVLLPPSSRTSPLDRSRVVTLHPQPVSGEDVQAQRTYLRDLLCQPAIADIGGTLTPASTGQYRDSLEHALESWSWDKVTTLPMTLLLDGERAVSQRRIYDHVYNALNDLVPREHVEVWILMALRWEMDGGEGEEGSNPFEFHHSLLSQRKVRADLYREDLVAIRSGQGKSIGGEEDTVSTVLATGLDLEEQQLQLSASIADLQPQSSGLREVGIVAEQGRLRQRIEAWLDIAQNLAPVITSLRARGGNTADTEPAQHLPLYLPSALCHAEGVDVRLFSHEWRLREAQAYDALAHLRAHLQVIAFLRSRAFKDPGVEDRANLVADIVRAKICMDVHRYRTAYTALVALAPVLGKTMEDEYLQELRDIDVQYISWADGVSTPWIWRFGQTALLDPARLLDLDVNKDLNTALRVEWYDARAHARTSMQMCKSLRDEMRRVVATHKHRAEWWETQIGHDFANCSDYREGADSYASRQASIRHSMKDHCVTLWTSIKDCLSTGPYDLVDYSGATSLGSGRGKEQ